jgi:hypothetical protein
MMTLVPETTKVVYNSGNGGKTITTTPVLEFREP